MPIWHYCGKWLRINGLAKVLPELVGSIIGCVQKSAIKGDSEQSSVYKVYTKNQNYKYLHFWTEKME